jgi:hypothetical protein
MTLYNVYKDKRLIAAGLTRPQLEVFLSYLAPAVRDEFSYKEM